MDKIKLTFLGTGDAIPSARRNHTSIFLNYKDENILIDCGEGTQRQFRKAGLNPCKITRIIITHWHGDHVLGIPGLLQTLALSGYSKVLHIFGPPETGKYLWDMKKMFRFHEGNYKIEVHEIGKKGKFYETDDFYLEVEQMNHRVPCNAYNFVVKDKIRLDKKKLEKSKIPSGPLLKKLKSGKDILIGKKKYRAKDFLYFEKGKKISFVLDTALNDRISNFVEGADVFVSESSFKSDLKERAREYFHMTVDQVSSIAKKSKVKKLFLTHVSSRYESNLKQVLDEAKKNFKESYLAKDLESIEV